MAATLHVLHPKPAPLAGFLRVGHTGQNKLAALHAAGRFPYRRVVFEAAHIDEQLELLKLLRHSGCEIVIDLNFAEMGTSGRYQGAVSRLPWANPERPWDPEDFTRNRNVDLPKLMAEHVVRHGASAVLSPSHIEDGLPQKWQGVDHRFCEKLREELDRLGGQAIDIDYQLITSTALFREERHRRELVEGIGDLPIQNLWLRLSGFGATATGAGTRHTIEAIRTLHEMGRPLVCDYVGGLAGLATLAFGAVAGISHGVAQKEGFNTYGWKHPQKGGNNSRRIYIAELDRYLTDEQLDTIFSARGGKSRFACNDTSCCADIDDMIDNSHAHFITQRVRQIEGLSHTIEARRAEHFLLHHVDPAIRSARTGARLKIASDPLKKLLSSSRGRLIRLRDALDDMRLAANLAGRSRAISFRGGGRAIGAVLGR